MLEIEKFPCTDSNEGHTQERYWIETLNATLNGHMPSRGRTECIHHYYEKNKEALLAYSKIHHNANKEHRYEKFKCECGGRYTFCDKTSHFKSQKHIRYIENPKLPITISTIECPCGGRYISKNKRLHVKTLKHLAYIENPESPAIFHGSECPCGGMFLLKNKDKHHKTKIHLAYLENIQSQSLAI
jgi:DNA-directed RNA polymerase subunit RPC12/RpoP